MEALESYLAGLGAPWRRVAPGEFGVSPDVGGAPLHVGLHARSGLLSLQAEVCGPGLVDPAVLLHRNRRLRLVRFSSSRAGAIWVQAELPLAALDAALLDRALGALVEAAEAVRALAWRDGHLRP